MQKEATAAVMQEVMQAEKDQMLVEEAAKEKAYGQSRQSRTRRPLVVPGLPLFVRSPSLARPRLHYCLLTLCPAPTDPAPRGLLTLWARAGMWG